MKRILAILLITTALICALATVTSAVTMYNISTLEKENVSDEVAAQCEEPTSKYIPGITLLSTDGKSTKVVSPVNVEKNLDGKWVRGWVMYSENGKTTVAHPDQIAEYEENGWKAGILLITRIGNPSSYSGASRIIRFVSPYNFTPERQKQFAPFSFSSTDWTVAITLYAANDRTIEILNTEVDAFVKAGWKSAIDMYTRDGKKITVNPFEAEKYEEQGYVKAILVYDSTTHLSASFPGYSYYTSPFLKYEPGMRYLPEITYFNNAGEARTTAPINVIQSLSYGDTRAVKLYSSDGREVTVHPNDVGEYKKVGWVEGYDLFKFSDSLTNQFVAAGHASLTISPFIYTEETKQEWLDAGWVESVKMFAQDGRTMKVPTNQVSVYKKAYWYTGYTLWSPEGYDEVAAPWDVEKYLEEGWKKPATVYYEDKSQQVNPFKIDEYVAAGWSAEPLYPMYAEDGRTIYVKWSETDAYEQVGWYRRKEDASVKMYAPENKSMWVFKGQVEAYKAVGWYLEPLMKMYAEDGRIIWIEESKEEAYEQVGWFDSEYDVTVLAYASDGRTMRVYKGKIDEYKALGWYPEIKIYKLNSQYTVGYESKTINPFEFEGYAKGGWYSEPIMKLYSIYGDSTVAPISQLAAYKAVGWYEHDEVYQDVYSLTDKQTVLKSEVWKYTSKGYTTKEPAFQIQKSNTGWGYGRYYRWPEFYTKGKSIYLRLPMLINLSKGKVIEKIDFQIKYFGSNGNRVKISTGKTYSNHTVYVYAASRYDSYATENHGNTPLGFGNDRLGGYIEEFNAPNYIHRIEITNYKAYFTDGTTVTIAGSVELYNKQR